MEFKHFSHPHSLTLFQIEHGQKVHCSGFETSFSGSAYGCAHCRFFLHEQCANASRTMQHQAHSFHHLTLLPYTTYSASSFLCNACGAPGSAFSFCCAACEFDLHVDCALLSQTMKHEAHPHELSLSFALLHHEPLPHPCDICHKALDSKLWTYNCTGCNFHAHTSCASKKIRQETYQAAGHTSFVSEPAMGHPGFHYHQENVPNFDQTKPIKSSGRPYITQSDLFTNQLARINDSINTLGRIGLQREEYVVPHYNPPRRRPKTQSDLYNEQLLRVNASINTLGSIG